jgi:hypothetical protein
MMGVSATSRCEGGVLTPGDLRFLRLSQASQGCRDEPRLLQHGLLGHTMSIVSIYWYVYSDNTRLRAKTILLVRCQ